MADTRPAADFPTGTPKDPVATNTPDNKTPSKHDKETPKDPPKPEPGLMFDVYILDKTSLVSKLRKIVDVGAFQPEGKTLADVRAELVKQKAFTFRQWVSRCYQ